MTTLAAQFDGHGSGAEHRTTGSRAWCFECKEWCYPEFPCGSSSCCSERKPAEPRSWSLPSEPGPEVTAVRDHFGQRWELLDDGGWRSGAARRGWGSLLADFGPLTDASADTT